jgi:HlyD family secretion protein
LRLVSVPEEVPLLVGYSADAEIVLETHENVVRVPVEAVLEGDVVLYVNAEKRLEKRAIKTGASNWTYREVTSGLQEGDQVLVSFDVPGAVAGAKIRVASADQEATP